MNLELEQGTGVSTYARNLSVMLHELGHRVHVVYGRDLRSRPRESYDDIEFFDAVGESPPRFDRFIRRYQSLALPALAGSLKVRELHFSGCVDHRQYGNRLPEFDRIYNGRNLFQHAYRHFKLYRKFLTVTGQDGIDIMHWTYPIPARVAGAKNIYTIHDLVPLKLPHTTLDDKRAYLALVQAIASDADLIVTVSEQSKRDIVAIAGASPEKVEVTYQAVEVPARLKDTTNEAVAREIKGTFGLEPDGYFLFLGAIEPKKNVGRLIEAYLGCNLSIPLVIAGPRAWMVEKELRIWQGLIDAKLGSARRIRMLGYVPYSALVYLMRGARALVFPSLYEGFGLPPLEAMSVGCPVITSNTGSLPEVCGDAALYVDPYQVAEIKEAILALADNEDMRQEMRKKGLEQVKRFSTAVYRGRLQEMYSRVADHAVASKVAKT
jgi:glycosyltransferase involved in cell wall biosynthesis